MKSHLAPLIEFWKQRNTRERAILAAGGGLLLLALIYGLVIAPVARERARLQASLPGLRADVARFQRDLQEAKGQPAGAANSGDISALVMAAGWPAGTATVDSKDDKHGAVHAKSVAWPSLTALMAAAQSQGWKLSKLSVRSPDGTDTVDADLEWTR
ncbi:type II secretion system protein M [Chitinimonas arctica]|uniref:Type II secretion system protein M n=1 Tax=Chitinimonas arctica TaxID=2594795 RepID=A0A516SCZ8_9NEIS|nr:type II secretion system protein GspM [Chitinimonas arctica]QDQ26021.1 type II secretion system protein M [Chitinimonas arctica]